MEETDQFTAKTPPGVETSIMWRTPDGRQNRRTFDNPEAAESLLNSLMADAMVVWISKGTRPINYRWKTERVK